MNAPSSNDDHLRAHPLLSQLLQAGPNIRAFRGYVGEVKDSERMRLYPSLGDLSFWVEFNKNDIVASAAAPETLLPHGGAVVWLQPDAEVRCHGDQINTVAARRPRRSGSADFPLGQASVADLSVAQGNSATSAAGRLVQVRAGRLNIRLRPRVMSSCASCSCSSCETNPSCTSNCNEGTRPVVVIGP